MTAVWSEEQVLSGIRGKCLFPCEDIGGFAEEEMFKLSLSKYNRCLPEIREAAKGYGSPAEGTA